MTITETCMHCGGTGGHVIQHDMHPRKDDGIIPLRSEWVGCNTCGQTGRVVPVLKEMRATFVDYQPTRARVAVHIPTRKQVAPGGAR